MRDAAALAWVVNLGCVDLNPQPVRAGDLDHPDELRIDLDPVPGVGGHRSSRSRSWRARCSPITGWSAGPRPRARAASTCWCGSARRGRSPRCGAPRWRWRARSSAARRRWPPASGGRRSATACSSTTTRTRAIARLRARTRCGRRADARVSMPLTWDALATCDPAAFTIATVPALVAAHGDAHAAIDDVAGALDGLLALAAAQEAAAGLGDAPWPPHFEKQAGEGRGADERRASVASQDAAVAARAADRPRRARAGSPRSRSSRSARPSARTTRWPGSRAGRRATRRSRPCSRPRTCWSTRCAAAARRTTGCGSTRRRVPEAEAAGRGRARSRLRSRGRVAAGARPAPTRAEAHAWRARRAARPDRGDLRRAVRRADFERALRAISAGDLDREARCGSARGWSPSPRRPAG